MDAIEKRARGLLAVELIKRRRPTTAGCVLEGREDDSAAIQALIAALTPPEGYVLVQETQLRHLLNDAITSVEFIAGRGQSKPLSRRVRDQAWALVESIPARRKVP
ncbi:hypothetical protein [Stenotrophomonas maltophilia]|uniref:hypothetical protein n=1 Tax=Stenotrophomonas maltophilia TaxID=40324 RepID=UPI002E794EE4|nr:hypothetical protein [Stenotrophomonas maltophilia]